MISSLKFRWFIILYLKALLVIQPVPAVLLLWAVWLLGRGCELDCGYGYHSAARTPTEITKKHKNIQQKLSLSLKRSVGDVVYLSGFVGVFHSGRLFYVDFCRIHTSRLLRK